MLSTHTKIIAALLFTVGRSCGNSDAGTGAPMTTTTTTTTTAATASTALAAQAAPSSVPAAPRCKDENEEEDEQPIEKFADAQRAFASAKETLLTKYYLDGVTEDDLYRGALQGMLEHAEPRMRKWNKLLGPAELAELRTDMKGEIVGVGVSIHFDADSGYSDVLGALPGSPAERAGLVSGDKVLSVNGKLYKGMKIRDVVGDIRGKAGETVTLSVLRGDKILTVPLKREAVTWDPATSMMLPDGVAYLRVRGFSAKTPSAVRTSIDALAQKSPKSVVVDLRGNHGGSLNDAIATAELLLPAGTGIVKIEKRGHKEESFVSKGPGLLAGLPMVVLVDGNTSSSAELVTAALQEGRHAQALGSRTFGKWTVQMIDDLPNGYAIKYTIGLFRSPGGKSFEGVGMAPDVDVSMDEKAIDRAQMVTDPDKRIAADVQLRTATTLLHR